MTLWIVLLLLLVALSPLTWLLPSAKQRGRMDLRLQARRMGLAMQLAPEQWPYWLQCSPPEPCPQYHRARSRGRQDTWAYWQSEPGMWLNKWQEPCVDEQLAAQLLTLPSDVYKVEATLQMVAICWGERGNAESLQAISTFLVAQA